MRALYYSILNELATRVKKKGFVGDSSSNRYGFFTGAIGMNRLRPDQAKTLTYEFSLNMC